MQQKKIKALAFLLCPLAWGLTHSAAPARPGPPAPARQEAARAASGPNRLTPQERRGKTIYQQGVSPSGGEIRALVGTIEVPGTTLNCAGCHGVRGQGKTEAGATAGNLTWANLLKPEGHLHPSGRRHKAFDEAGVLRAITAGSDSSGNALATIMPRYRMSEADLADLVAYLKRIEADGGSGVTADAVKLGAVLPLTGGSAGAGRAAREVLAAYFAAVNEAGGIFHRKVELRVVDGGEGGGGLVSGVRGLADDEQVFAVLSGYGAGGEVSRLVAEAGLPYLSLAAGAGQAAEPPGRYSFRLLPDLRGRAGALVAYAAARAQRGRRLVVLYPEGRAEPSLLAAVEDEGRRGGYAEVSKAGYKAGRAAAAGALKSVGEAGADVLLLTDGRAGDRELVRALSSAKGVAALLLPGHSEPGEVLGAVAPGAPGEVYVTASGPDGAAGAPAEYREFAKRHGLSPSHPAERLAAYAAARTFVEGLKVAGRDLSQEQFVGALESLRDFDTGGALRVSFGPDRRVGSGAVRILRVDARRRALTPAPHNLTRSTPAPGSGDQR